jgi:hypothetical protein
MCNGGSKLCNDFVCNVIAHYNVTINKKILAKYIMKNFLKAKNSIKSQNPDL